MFRPFLSLIFTSFIGVASLQASRGDEVCDDKDYSQGLQCVCQDVDGEGMFLCLEGNSLTTARVAFSETSPLGYAKRFYSQMGGPFFTHGADTEVVLSCDYVEKSAVVAVAQDITWKAPMPIASKTSIFHAQKDVNLCAPSLSFDHVFCSSIDGSVTLKAPEGSQGFLRSITFEYFLDKRPFDMCFISGTVSFEMSRIEDLIVAGVSKVIVEVAPRS